MAARTRLRVTLYVHCLAKLSTYNSYTPICLNENESAQLRSMLLRFQLIYYTGLGAHLLKLRSVVCKSNCIADGYHTAYTLIICPCTRVSLRVHTHIEMCFEKKIIGSN